MTKREKDLIRLLSKPRDYRFAECKVLLERFGYKEIVKGKTSGSRVQFYRELDKKTILLHKPHPKDIMKRYSIEDVIEKLKDNGDI